MKKSSLWWYGIAALAVAGIVIFRLMLVPVLGEGRPYLPFVITVVVSAWCGGLLPGLFAVALSVAAGHYFFSESILNAGDAAYLAIFVTTGILISALCEQLHRTRERVEKNENAIRCSEERYRSFIQQSSEGIWRFEGGDGRSIHVDVPEDEIIDSIYAHAYLAECNDTMARMYGFASAGDIQGIHLADLLPRTDPHNIEFLRAFIRSGFRLNGAESHEVDKDGNPKHFLNNFFGIVENGCLVRAWGMQRDITPLHQSEEALKRSEERIRESEERYALAIRGSNDGIWDWDIRVGVLYWSDRLKEQLGYPSHFVPTFEAWWNAIHPEDRQNVENALSAHLAGETEFFHLTFRDSELNGRWRWVYARGVALRDAGGTPFRMAGTRTDITEQKELEAKLREALDKAESANQAKSEFLANMSHEIRTPMNAVVGLANILAMSTPLTPRQEEFVRTLQLSAKSLLSLLNDLLDIARIESTHVQLEQRVFNLETLARDVVDMMAVKVREKGLTLTLECHDATVSAEFTGDPDRIRQILVNLVSNAIKFTEKGSVTVRLFPYHNGQSGKEEVCIEVHDTGIGILEEKQQVIFDQFSQADTSITRRYGGTGLGLTITQMLVELMGGTIALESHVGRGSVFTVRLPLPRHSDRHGLQDNRDAGADGQGESGDRREGPFVLLVEDYPPNILVATTLLEQLGCRYETARHGREALERFKKCRYDLVLMDVQMPEIDGYQATRLIRELEATRGLGRTPVLGVTAHALSGDREKCLEAGMDDYISKPFTPEELQEKIVALDRKRELAA